MMTEDFVQFFNTYYKCNLLDERVQSVTLQGEWKGPTAGGCRYPLKLVTCIILELP